MAEGDPAGHAPPRRSGLALGVVAFAMAAAPAVAAVWAVPGFVTQDGPAHVYNAHILLEALRLGPDSPFASAYEPSWRPVPNLGGHLALMGMLAALPARSADRLMTTASLAGFGLAVVWLRWRVAGRRGLGTAAVLSGLLAINMPWLMGFSNFLIGATLAVVTWGVAWPGPGSGRSGPARAAGIGALLVLGYLGHLVSLAVTVPGLIVLALLAPGGRPDRGRRLAWTLVGCLPVVPLGLLYMGLSSEGGAFAPSWERVGPWWSPGSWARRASWVDPIAIARRDFAPLLPGVEGGWCLLLSPSLWLGLGLAAAIGATIRGALPWSTWNREFPGGWGRAQRAPRLVSLSHLGARCARPQPPRPPMVTVQSDFGSDGDCPGGRRAWAALAGCLLVGAAIGPDGLGDAHGYFLSQRIALLGLAALVPALEFGTRSALGRLASGLFGVALLLQSAFVWDYAAESDARAGALLAARAEVGRGVRVGTALVDIRGRYRSNPLLHADCLLGVGSGNVVWSNYEPRHYYFPVQLRPGAGAPPSRAFEDLAISGDAPARAALWDDLIGRHGGAIDVLVCWGHDPGIEAINARWAGSGPVIDRGAVRVYRRLGPGGRLASAK